MGSSFPCGHSVHSSTLSCFSICHPSRVISSSFSLLTCPSQLGASGFGATTPPPRGGRVFREDYFPAAAGAFSWRSLKLRGFSCRSLYDAVAFQSRNQQVLLSNSDSIADGTRRRSKSLLTTKASTKEREWHDYENAVQHKELAEAAPEVLDVLNSFESGSVSSPAAELAPSTSTPSFLKDSNTATSHIGRPWTPDDWNVLDACQMISDLTQVGKAYDWLFSKGYLPNFGKEKDHVSEGERRLVTEAVLKDSIGLTASKLSPKKWGLSGTSAIALPIGIAFFSYIRDSDAEVRPLAALILAFGFYDALYLGGTGLSQIRSMWLPHKRRVLVHEAGHVLVAYLLGCPIRGVILDPMQAFKLGVQGQGGAQFWDQTLEMEFSQVGLPSSTVDRYSIILFAGIAAEALIYGEAQGGESDENLFKAVVAQLQPSWSPAKMSDQARWAILQAFQLLKDHKTAHAAVVRALEQGSSLGSLIRAIEGAMP